MLAAAVITAIATAGLAFLAYRQMRASDVQMRGARAQADAAIALAKQQTTATLEIARETREAAERQWQPRVFVHGKGRFYLGHGHDDVPEDQVGVPYYLSNEGTGPAFNVEHGIEIAGKSYTWNDWQWRSMRAGEFIPPLSPASTQPVPEGEIVVLVPALEWERRTLVYWSRFENLLGDRFEVRNYDDPRAPSRFLRL
ncbi:MAG TPA: hypothetical protein VH081_05965 [Solirubrobacteraceae bacterium]|jgi:hypothetical protein|nr:hypothetical protein [Solirubrobacteraceae bacterium]